METVAGLTIVTIGCWFHELQSLSIVSATDSSSKVATTIDRYWTHYCQIVPNISYFYLDVLSEVLTVRCCLTYLVQSYIVDTLTRFVFCLFCCLTVKDRITTDCKCGWGYDFAYSISISDFFADYMSWEINKDISICWFNDLVLYAFKINGPFSQLSILFW